MSDTSHFAGQVALVALAGLAAVYANRLTERLRIPAPLLLLLGAALCSTLLPGVSAPALTTVEHVVTVALVLVLFDGGMHIGVRRFRAAAGPIAVVGVLGTFLTTAGAALLLHTAFGLSAYASLLVATAVAPTDPAVVFSVLGQREVEGRSGTILEGESGANDPVGIALMASLLSAGGVSSGALGSVAGEFVLQMLVGAAVGVVGGRLLLLTARRIPLPSEALYPLRTALVAFVLFGAASLAHGSGFLAVFVAGILFGDVHAPYKREVERFHSALASLGEIVAFVLLGLTVDLGRLLRAEVLVPGVVLAAVLAVVVRPLCAGVCLLPARLRPNELAFVLFAGLKGAVPILLAEMLRAADVPQADRLFDIVVVVVVLSVLVQGGLVPAATRLLRLPVRTSEPEPWALGVRLRDEPRGVHRVRVEEGSSADGATIDELGDRLDDAWVSIVVRESALVPVRGGTRLQPGDEVVVLAPDEEAGSVETVFAPRSTA
ncbi:sodium/proton antiporter (CPA1 family) [Motilibacter rhizosphaerae]|uniref:Sodium/proton antiporter (CPA1 family) n=1 Tax=Motilibacter rhizosphaerae TaxID=598652 RepID=A0A4Q7NQH0_9ACTN|nr:cation:proton antiporter [Motilibacter rhizosphaerae]RZS87584.1 sodium/proton antiporter (CPA1 family) [Motilibacter rhizosphaerae]